MVVNGRPVRIVASPNTLVSPGAFGLGQHMLRMFLSPNVTTTHSRIFTEDNGDQVRVMVRRVAGDRTLYLHFEKITCDDKRGFLLLAENSQKMHASYCDGFIEQIDPLDGVPRPDPDPAQRTKFQRIPTLVRPPVQYHAGQFSGQMKAVVQCLILRGKDAPMMSPTWSLTHGIVETPFPRPANKRRGETWLVEIGGNGVFAMPFQYTGRCCDLDDQLNGQAEVKLYTLFGKEEWPQIKQLCTQEQMQLVYGKGAPPWEKCGWAFSYSGHEAANVVYEPHNSPENYWLVSLVKVKFTWDADTQTLSAEPKVEENKKQYVGSASALFWTPSDSSPGAYEQLFPFEFNGGAPQIPWGGIPLYCFYSGDDIQVLRTTKAIATGGPTTGPDITGDCTNLISLGQAPTGYGVTWQSNWQFPQGNMHMHAIGGAQVHVDSTTKRQLYSTWSILGAPQYEVGNIISGTFCGITGHLVSWGAAVLMRRDSSEVISDATGRIGAIALQSDREAVCLVSSVTTTSTETSSVTTTVAGTGEQANVVFDGAQFPSQSDAAEASGGGGWHPQVILGGGVLCTTVPALGPCNGSNGQQDETFPGCCGPNSSGGGLFVRTVNTCKFLIRDRIFEVEAEKYGAAPFTEPINPSVSPPFRNPGPDGLCSGMFFVGAKGDDEGLKNEDKGRKYVLKGGPPVTVPSSLKSILVTGPLSTAASVCFVGRV